MLVFNSQGHTDLNLVQNRFLNKIKSVAQNNNVNVIPQDSAFEALIDEKTIWVTTEDKQIRSKSYKHG
jgi:hypothetical protein